MHAKNQLSGIVSAATVTWVYSISPSEKMKSTSELRYSYKQHFLQIVTSALKKDLADISMPPGRKKPMEANCE